jgi:hypothetical protein
MRSTLKKLPVGTAAFDFFNRSNLLYADKTALLYNLVTNSHSPYFLSRPRRFGKTLLVSTLEEILTGQKKLFENLWIYESDYSWEPYPVIHLPMNAIDVESEESAKDTLLAQIKDIAL